MTRNARRLGVLGVLAAWLWSGSGCASRTSTATSPPATPKRVRVLTWNIRHGEGTDGRIDLSRLSRLILRERPDLVALQEVDRGVARSGRRDIPAELAAQTGMTAVFRRNITYQGGDYGNAILSRWPVVAATNRPYRMLRAGEQRAVLQIAVEFGSRRIGFWNTHVDYRKDDAERRLHVAELLAEPVESGCPVILCGDFNDFPASPAMQALSGRFEDAWERHGQGPGYTYPSARPDRRIDYVWVQREAPLRVHSARVLFSDGSDHLPLLVELAWTDDHGAPGAFSVPAGAGSR